MNTAAVAILPSQESADDTFEETAVVPKSQMMFEMAAAVPLSSKIAAPIPQCFHGLMLSSALVF
jgi:hypothetical protein